MVSYYHIWIKAVADGSVDLFLVKPLFLKVRKDKIPFLQKQVINKSASVFLNQVLAGARVIS